MLWSWEYQENWNELDGWDRFRGSEPILTTVLGASVGETFEEYNNRVATLSTEQVIDPENFRGIRATISTEQVIDLELNLSNYTVSRLGTLQSVAYLIDNGGRTVGKDCGGNLVREVTLSSGLESCTIDFPAIVNRLVKYTSVFARSRGLDLDTLVRPNYKVFEFTVQKTHTLELVAFLKDTRGEEIIYKDNRGADWIGGITSTEYTEKVIGYGSSCSTFDEIFFVFEGVRL